MKKLLFWCAAVFWLVGSILILYHPMKSWRRNLRQRQVIESFEKRRREIQERAESSLGGASSEATDDAGNSIKEDLQGVHEKAAYEVNEEANEAVLKETSEDSSRDSLSNETTEEISYKELYEEAKRYNRLIYAYRQKALKDAWTDEQPVFSLQSDGMTDYVFGVVRIPKMEVELPLYLGASTGHMEQGAVILGESSLPIRGENTNCVIAAHRGWGSSPMFRDIENLRIGDMVYIDNLWETLAYRVEMISVILPGDVDSFDIQKGKELVTLMTCHPYGEDDYRYVVYCTRQEYLPLEAADEDGYRAGATLVDAETAAPHRESKALPMEVCVPGEDEARLQMELEKWFPAMAVLFLSVRFYLFCLKLLGQQMILPKEEGTLQEAEYQKELPDRSVGLLRN